MINALYADTWDNLTVEMLGYYHDHCYHFYTGLTENVPEHLQKYITENGKYVLIYEEDEPN